MLLIQVANVTHILGPMLLWRDCHMNTVALRFLVGCSKDFYKSHIPGIETGLTMSFAVAPRFSSATLITLCSMSVLAVRCIV
jgi:hypothetical protein